MKKKSAEELETIIEKHGKWLRGEDGGERADLAEADLSRADLRRADLRGVIMVGARLFRGGPDRSDVQLRDAILGGPSRGQVLAYDETFKEIFKGGGK